MKKVNKLKRIFATTAAFATLATIGVTATVHADSSNVPGSGTPGFVNGDSKQWAIDHGYLNPDGTSTVYNQPQPASKKTTIDQKTKDLGYHTRTTGTYNGKPTQIIIQNGKTPTQIATSYAINDNNASWPDIYYRGEIPNAYVDGFKGGVSPTGSLGLESLSSQLPKPANAPMLFQMFAIQEFFAIKNRNNQSMLLNSHPKYVNSKVLYSKWLHINVDKVFSFKKQTTDPKNYYKSHKETNIMEKGYSLNWLHKKLVWMLNNNKAAVKEFNKYYKQVILQDQRTRSTANDFDNTTIK